MGYSDAINWFDLLQSAGIIGGFLFTAHSIRQDNKARRISYLNVTTDRHWQIWKGFHNRPELSRVLEKMADVAAKPITNDEELFVTQLIIHLDTVHQAIQAGMFVRLAGLKTDIKEFFLLPIPRAVWDKTKPFRDDEFIQFVESAWE